MELLRGLCIAAAVFFALFSAAAFVESNNREVDEGIQKRAFQLFIAFALGAIIAASAARWIAQAQTRGLTIDLSRPFYVFQRHVP